MAKPIQIVVGGGGQYDPAAGTSIVNIPSLAGKEFYVEEIGVGTLPYDLWANRTLSNPALGGFSLVGNTFNLGDVYTIHETSKLFSSPFQEDINYTNGFNFSKVAKALFGRIGWRQSVGAPALSSNNLATASGRYFNGFHALCNISNIKSTCEDANISDDDFNSLLESMYTDIMFRCLNGVFNEPELIEQVLLFNRFGYNDFAVSNSGLFIGYEICIAPQVGFATQIDSVALYFDSARTFNLYLFKDGVKAPLKTIEVTTVAGEQTVIDLQSCVLTYLSSGGNGSRFWLGYFQDDLTGAKAIQENVDCWNKTCLFSARPLQAPTDGATSFDRDHRQFPALPYGLNLTMSSFRDHTDRIIRNANLFDEVIGLQMAAQVVENIMHSTRSNGNERILKDGVQQMMVYMDLKGTVPVSDAPSTTGLSKQIERELVRLKKTFFPRPKGQIINLSCDCN